MVSVTVSAIMLTNTSDNFFQVISRFCQVPLIHCLGLLYQKQTVIFGSSFLLPVMDVCFLLRKILNKPPEIMV